MSPELSDNFLNSPMPVWMGMAFSFATLMISVAVSALMAATPARWR